jgi:hypothetical protein
MGHLHLARRRWRLAEGALKTCLAIFEDTGELDDVGRVCAALLPCAAHAGAWRAWDKHLERARDCLGRTQRADRDVAADIDLAASLAQDAQQHERAQEARLLARQQWALLKVPPQEA